MKKKTNLLFLYLGISSKTLNQKLNDDKFGWEIIHFIDYFDDR